MHLPDEYQPIEERLVSKIARMKKIIILLIIISLALLISTITLAVQRSSSDPSAQNAELKAQNQRLILQNKQTDQKIGQLDEENIALQQSISELDADVDATGKQIDELQAKIKQNCDITMQKLFFNYSNIDNFTLSMPQATREGLPAIASLNLTGNTLTNFCKNSLPDLQSLDLRNNRLQNLSSNYLPNLNELDLYEVGKIQQFSNNLLPLVTALNFTNHPLSSFKGNILPQMKSLILDTTNITVLQGCIFLSLENISSKKTSLSTLSKNTFPKLADFDFRSITKMVGNDLGAIASITFSYGGKQVLIFEQNKLPAVTQLQFEGMSYDMEVLKTNYMPQLASFTFQAGILTNFQYYAQLRLLSRMQLHAITVNAFSNHEYPNMKQLILYLTGIKQFANNKLPELQNLTIVDAEAPDICSGNLMLSLKSLTIQMVNSIISNNSCLAKFQALESLEVSSPTLDKFQNYYFPQLKSLTLKKTSLGKQMLSFQNNRLPKLKELSLDVQGPYDLHPYQNTLVSLRLSGPITNFSAYEFPNLRKLALDTTVKNINFSSCNFPALEELSLSGMQCSLKTNRYSQLRTLTFSNGYGDIIIGQALETSLERLVVFSTTMTTFNDHFMPNLTQLSIFRAHLYGFNNNSFPKATKILLPENQLITIDCHSMPQVVELTLYGNLFKDDIVDAVINCNLNRLAQINLRGNRIQDPVRAYDRLNIRYPKATIMI